LGEFYDNDLLADSYNSWSQDLNIKIMIAGATGITIISLSMFNAPAKSFITH